MKRLLILLYLLNFISARKIEITVNKLTNNGPLESINSGFCSVFSENKDSNDVSKGKTTPVNAGVASFSNGQCALLVDEDNQKSTDYDYVTPAYFSQPTQIQTDQTNKDGLELCTKEGNIQNGDLLNEKCIVYSVKVDNEEPAGTAEENKVKYSGCNVELRGLGSSDDDNDNTHTGSVIHLQKIGGIGISGLANDDHDASKLTDDNAVYVASTRTCHFMPVNHKFLGKVEAIVKFKLTDPQQDEVDDLYVKVAINFVPHLASKFANYVSRDKDINDQHDAFVLMAKSNVNNQKNDKCKALDGIDITGIQRDNNAKLTDVKCQNSGMTDGLVQCSTKTNELPSGTVHELNTRSTGSGCITTGNTPHLYTEAETAGKKSASISLATNPTYKQIEAADGVAVKFRVMGHFFDRRYKVKDQTSVEALEDNIGDFEISTQSLNIKADYIKIGHTRQDHKTSNLNLVRLNIDDYSSGCLKQVQKPFDEANQLPKTDVVTNDKHALDQACIIENSDNWSSESVKTQIEADISGHDYAQYYFDHDHKVAYEHVKHIQDTYINDNPTCGTTGYGQTGVSCTNALVVAGFTNDVIVKIPVSINDVIPKAPWNIFIPKLDIISYGKSSVLKLSSDDRIPTFGLPVLDTALEPQYSDGYPLSHFFKINGVLNCENDISNCDEVDSYDDKYELFARLTKVESNTNNAVEYYDSISGNPILCSSNRAYSNDGAYGQGRVKDIGIVYVTETGVPVGTYMTQSQLFLDKCRIQINANIYLDQIIFSWNNDNQVNDARMCQEDEKTPKVQKDSADIIGCSSYSPPSRLATTNFNDPQCTNCAKLTIIDRRKVLIGSTELSLLRRQEVFAGQGVEVTGSTIGFLLGKENDINEKTDSNGNAYGEGVLEFDIWGTDSMQGYKQDATPCVKPDDTQQGENQIGPLCQEAHGCTVTDGLFGDAVDGDSADLCAEKKVKTPRNDGEFTFHTIRSNSNCNGKLDIQLRLRQSGDADCANSQDCNIRSWSTSNLLGSDGSSSGFLRPLYDVRLPCSRVSRKTSDSIALKYKFSLAYNLQTDVFSVGAQGIAKLGSQDLQFADSKFAASGNTGSSGFTKAIEYKAYVGSCPNNIQSFDDLTDLCSTTFLDAPENVDGLVDIDHGKLIADVSGDCDALVFSDTKDANNKVVSLDQDISLALIYKRTYSYKVDRDHLLDTNVVNTEFDNTQYFCEDQKFSISLNPTKTASVSVITPIQLVVERQAQIVGITWHGNNDNNPSPYNGVTDSSPDFPVCGAQTYQLRVLVKLQEQGTHASNAESEFTDLLSDFTAEVSQSTDGLEVKKIINTDGTFIALLSPCILITADDCTGTLDSQWKELTQTNTNLLVSSLDTVLGAGSASGTTITSEVEISTDYSSCPVDIENVEESGEFATAVSFAATNCLLQQGTTALDKDGNQITNCASALVTESGTASIHAYTVASGKNVLDIGANALYIQGSDKASADGTMSIDTAVVVLKRYEKIFGGNGKGQQLGEDIELCSKSSGSDLIVSGNPGIPKSEGGQFDLDVSVDTNKFDCSFKFIALGEANMLNDVWEIEIEIVMKNTARRLRASKELRLKASDPLSSAVGFEIVSDTTTVSEQTQASAVVEPQTQSSEPVHQKENQFDFGILAVIIFGVLALLALGYWLMQRRNRNGYIAVENPAIGAVGVKPRFNNLRY